MTILFVGLAGGGEIAQLLIGFAQLEEALRPRWIPLAGFQIASRSRAVVALLEIEIAGGDVAAGFQRIERVLLGLEVGIFFRGLLLLSAAAEARAVSAPGRPAEAPKRGSVKQRVSQFKYRTILCHADLRERAAELPLLPGVYLYKDADGTVIYVGKAKNLRRRVRSYFSDDRLADSKTGTLICEARDIDYILVDNEKEALALENNLIKQYKPRFNILLRDDKTYPYIKLTSEKYPRVYVTRRLSKDGVDLLRPVLSGQSGAPAGALHSPALSGAVLQGGSDALSIRKPCLQFHIHRCLGPCVAGLTTDEAYADAVRDVRLFLEGRHSDLARELRARMEAAAEEMRFEEAAALRDLLTTVEEMEERQKMAAAEGDDIDIFAYYAEPPLVAVNLFHLRNGQIVDRREFFWEDQHGVRSSRSSSRRCCKQIYLDQQYVPAIIHVPVDFEDREVLEELLSREARPQGGDPHAAARAEEGACWTWWRPTPSTASTQRFRVLKPSSQAIQEALQDALNLPERAAAHRVLRHLAHPGHRQSGQHGGVGRRADEEVRLPQVHHPDGGGQRRFREHARSGHAPLLAAARKRSSRGRGWC